MAGCVATIDRQNKQDYQSQEGNKVLGEQLASCSFDHGSHTMILHCSENLDPWNLENNVAVESANTKIDKQVCFARTSLTLKYVFCFSIAIF